MYRSKGGDNIVYYVIQYLFGLTRYNNSFTGFPY